MAERGDRFRERLLATFRIEADDHLRILAQELDALSGNPAGPGAAEHIALLFRTMHTLKGAARSVGLEAIETQCQRCESLLRDVTLGREAFGPEMLRFLRDTTDSIAGSLAGGRQAAAPAAPAPAMPPAAVADAPVTPTAAPPPASEAETVAAVPAPSLSSIRVEAGRLDRLMVLAENLVLPKLSAAEHVRDALDIARDLAVLRDRLSALRRQSGFRRGSGEPARLDLPEDELRGVEARLRRLIDGLETGARALQVNVDEIADEVRRLRMLPVALMVEAFPRMVRDLCRETGKEVVWTVSGGAVEVDRKVFDAVKDPLIHLVRNAVDHGIEPPADRIAAGKPREGRIALKVAPGDGGRLVIEISDDGRGFATDAIREAAVRSRAVSAEVAGTLAGRDATDLAFLPGVSTGSVITAISGHGLGLAIVRERVEQLDGRLELRTAPGSGSVIRFDLPSSAAAYRGLLIRAGGQRFLWPMESVERAFGLPPAEVAPSLARHALAVEGETLPLGELSVLLGLGRSAEAPASRAPCLMVRGGDRRGVLLVDEVIGEFDVVIKDFRPPLQRLPHVLSAGLLGTGDLVTVLRPSDVLQTLQTRPRAEPAPAAAPAAMRRQRLLVVDDSMTTRTMERNLFEAAGYSVKTAVDGLDAWSVLFSEEVDLVVSDVDMPGLDGFELTSRIRAEPRLRHLPVVLVTALESREDKERGIRVGANAYVLKSSFNQSNLLDIVGRLI